MNIDYEYQPYTYEKVRLRGFFGGTVYKVLYEGTHIRTVDDFDDAKSLVSALNGAFLMGQNHYAQYRMPR